jgi:hypothetical protein
MLRRVEMSVTDSQIILGRQAASVVASDAARAAATADFQSGQTTFDELVASFEAQKKETFAFLQGLTDYNRAIAEYALATLPASATPDQVVVALMPRG